MGTFIFFIFMILCRKNKDMGENRMCENMLEKIEIKKIEKEQFDKYKDEIEKNNIQIKQIAISKEFQGLKIGTHLLNKVKEYAKEYMRIKDFKSYLFAYSKF